MISNVTFFLLFVFHLKYTKSHAQLKEKGNELCTNVQGVLITIAAFSLPFRCSYFYMSWLTYSTNNEPKLFNIRQLWIYIYHLSHYELFCNNYLQRVFKWTIEYINSKWSSPNWKYYYNVDTTNSKIHVTLTTNCNCNYQDKITNMVCGQLTMFTILA